MKKEGQMPNAVIGVDDPKTWPDEVLVQKFAEAVAESKRCEFIISSEAGYSHKCWERKEKLKQVLLDRLCDRKKEIKELNDYSERTVGW